ncbi:hypothetical protein CANARDRAFT_27993 [[Candida] arabinofermentans NRRL YB-2248]|uniref:Uncharacterized protein n=1 Tax=[Candida] arabinofermentans NRRL YB-2248 TaxID=983967 RepID=A0A1E4T2F7_9ASCO|nr:hypothetical protein CANARDRAFT_27993 [[Candida] arabinofermentans NRRL YB-2248]
MTIPNQIKACLFDMDGLIIDSESVYTISFSEILQSPRFNRPEGLTWENKVKLQGLPGTQATQTLIDAMGLKDVTAEELYKLTSERQEELWPVVKFMPGALELIKTLHSKGVPIGICTSSASDKFKVKTGHLQEGFKLFDNVVTGDNEVIKGKGKPLPFIWWLGLDELNTKCKNEGRITEDIKINECLIFEDAVPGFISGKRAGGYVIWVPDQNALNLLSDKEVKGMIGENNEYGELLTSLEELDLKKYGL